MVIFLRKSGAGFVNHIDQPFKKKHHSHLPNGQRDFAACADGVGDLHAIGEEGRGWFWVMKRQKDQGFKSC